MATLAISQLGGLDNKSNHLSRPADKASDMLNMEYDTETTIKKRNGYEEVESIVSDDFIYSPTLDEKMFFTNGSTDVYIKGNGYTKTLTMPFNVGSSTGDDISSCENTLSMYFTKTDYSFPVVKYDGSHFYRAGLPTPRQASDAMPSATNAAGGSTRIFYSYKDISGLTVFSPYYELFDVSTKSSYTLTGASVLTVNSLKTDATCSENGFFDKYCWVAPSFNFIVDASSAITTYPQISSDASRTMIVKRHNYKAGEKFLFDAENPMNTIYDYSSYPGTKPFLVLDISAVENDTTKAVFTGSTSGTTLTVTAITSGTILIDGIISGGTLAAGTYITQQLTGTTGGTGTYRISVSQTVSSATMTEKISSITFKQDLTQTYVCEVGPVSQLGTFWPSNNLKTEFPLDIRTKLHVYDTKITASTFTKAYEFILDNSITTMSKTVGASPTTDYFRATIPIVSFSVEYMEDVYNTSSSKIMPPICKYIATYGDQIIYGSVQSYIGFNNKRVQYNNNDLIIYSDILTGDCCENTSEFNRQKIGESYDGEISGVARCNDSVVVFKDNSTFTLDGILSPGQYSIRKINTNGVGCSSHKSIVSTDEGLYFQAHNGIYFTNGINVKRISYELDSFFGSGDYSAVKAARFKKKQKTIFYIPTKSKAVVVDYYYGQVYVWDSFSTIGGLIEDKNGEIYFSDKTKLYKFKDDSSATRYSDLTVTPINAYYATTYHHMGQPSLNKKFVQMRLFSLTGDAFTATVELQKDWSDSTTKSFTKKFGSSDQSFNCVFDMMTALSTRFIFKNNIKDENLVITGYEITYEPYNVRDKN